MFSLFSTLIATGLFLCHGAYHTVVNPQSNYTECRNDNQGSRFVCCLRVTTGTQCPVFWSNQDNLICATARVQMINSRNACPTLNLQANFSFAQQTCTDLYPDAELCRSEMSLYSPGLMSLGCGTNTADHDVFTIRTSDQCIPDATDSPTSAPTTQVPTTAISEQVCVDQSVSYLPSKSSSNGNGNHTLVFAAQMQYFDSVEISSGICKSTDLPQQGVGEWTTTRVTDQCFEYKLEIPTNDLLEHCGFIKSTSTTGLTTFTAYFNITTSSTQYTLDGIFTEYSSSQLMVMFEYTTQFSVDTAGVQLYGDNNAAASVQTYSVEYYARTNTLSVQLLVTTQFPYQVSTPVLSDISGWTTLYTEFVSPPGGLGCSSIDTVCYQLIHLTSQPMNSCETDPALNITRPWTIGLNLVCRQGSVVACDNSNLKKISIGTKTAGSKVCTRSEGQSVQSSMVPTSADGTQTTKFTLGTITNYVIEVTAPLHLDALIVGSCTIARGYPGPAAILVYSHDPVESYYGYNETASVRVIHSLAVEGNPFKMKAVIQIKWLYGITTASNGKLAMPTTLNVLIRVTYKQANSGRRLVVLEHTNASARRLAVAEETNSLEATIMVGGEEESETTTPPQTIVIPQSETVYPATTTPTTKDIDIIPIVVPIMVVLVLLIVCPCVICRKQLRSQFVK